ATHPGKATALCPTPLCCSSKSVSRGRRPSVLGLEYGSLGKVLIVLLRSCNIRSTCLLTIPEVWHHSSLLVLCIVLIIISSGIIILFGL
ncbi:unnamed protein product, partial [Heterosigma akashiwo]